MEAYLDNSATTSCSKAATEKMVELLTQDYGNPSSMHMKGVIAADGGVKQVEYPDYYSISLTIEGPVVEKEEGYFVEGVVELKTNSEMNTVTKYAKPVIKVTGISE